MNDEINTCPYCQSTNTKHVSSQSDDFKCLGCGQLWDPSLLWIHNGFKQIFRNFENRYKSMSDEKKEEINKRILNFKDRYSASDKIKDVDPVGCMVLLLLGMEEVCESIAMILTESLPTSYQYSHEVKMTPYIAESLADKDPHDTPCLFLDISGKKDKPKYITEEEFWKKEEDKSWKSISERYGVMFRHGRYYRTEKWKTFLKKENPKTAEILKYCGAFLIFLIERDFQPGLPRWLIDGGSRVIPWMTLKKLYDFLASA